MGLGSHHQEGSFLHFLLGPQPLGVSGVIGAEIGRNGKAYRLPGRDGVQLTHVTNRSIILFQKVDINRRGGSPLKFLVLDLQVGKRVHVWLNLSGVA